MEMTGGFHFVFFANLEKISELAQLPLVRSRLGRFDADFVACPYPLDDPSLFEF
jgi:hypothetical protein